MRRSVGNEEAMDQLLKAGADLFASSTAELETEARRTRLQRGKIWGKIQETAAFCSPECAQRYRRVLLNANVEISATTCHKRTALHYAAIGHSISYWRAGETTTSSQMSFITCPDSCGPEGTTRFRATY